MRTVHEMSELTGVSVRTLHHYDAIGLLKPTEVTKAGYRLYDDAAVSRLQTILLFRELQFPLKEIKNILAQPDFDVQHALDDQIALLTLQKKRFERLIALAHERKRGVNMDFSAFDNIPVKDYELLRPFFEHGVSPVIFGAIFPASGFVELFLLIFLHHRLKGPLKFKHFAIMLVLLVGLTLGPLIGAITEFGPTEAAKQRYPAYEEWGLATIGRFIEHLDFFSFYQWLTGAFIRISIILYIVVQLLQLTGKKKDIWRYVAPPFFFFSLSLSLIECQIIANLINSQVDSLFVSKS